MSRRKDAQKYAALNRRARFDYAIETKVEAGIMLTGTEVKALRAGRASIAEAHAGPKQGEIYLFNANFGEYAKAGSHLQHEARRPRKLLLRKSQRDKFIGAVQREGMTMVPISVYFNARGIAKLELGLAKGRKKEDKRAVIKEREWKRQKSRILRQK
jgi:SsrA-binding protein